MENYLYHPFQSSTFVVFSPENLLSKNRSGFAIHDINLYYQPVQNPVIGLVFFLIRVPLVILGEVLYVKQLALIKRETSVVNDVCKLLAYFQMIFWPIWLLFTTATDFLHPLGELAGPWLCDVGWFFIHFCWNVIAFNSFIVAFMRYCFVVHNEKFDKGDRKKRVKRVFFIIHIFIPLFMIVWNGIEGSNLDVLSFINKCRGRHHQVFLIETSTLNIFKRNFCEFNNYDGTAGLFGEFNAIFWRISCLSRTAIKLIVASNSTEAIIYYLTLSHIARLGFILN